jgi:hypothetical protein
MTEPNPDRWASRDLPVLKSIVRRLDGRRAVIQARDVTEDTGLTAAEATAAVMNLRRGSYVIAREVWAERDFMVTDITDKALYAAEVWPTEEMALDRMIAALETIAANTDDEDTRSRARRVLDGLADSGRQIGIAVAGAAISGKIPGAGQ